MSITTIVINKREIKSISLKKIPLLSTCLSSLEAPSGCRMIILNRSITANTEYIKLTKWVESYLQRTQTASFFINTQNKNPWSNWSQLPASYPRILRRGCKPNKSRVLWKPYYHCLFWWTNTLHSDPCLKTPVTERFLRIYKAGQVHY